MKARVVKRIAVMALCLLMLVMIVPVQSAEAANVCKQIEGSSKAKKVFYVSTGSRWIANKDVVKFTQSKGVMKINKRGIFLSDYMYHEYPPFSDTQNATQKMYEVYAVKVEKLNNKNEVVKTQTYKFDGGSIKIKLDKNSNYRITVTPTFVPFYNKCKDMTPYQWTGLNNCWNPYKKEMGFLKQLTSKRWVPLGWQTNSTWRVSSTKGINECSFNN